MARILVEFWIVWGGRFGLPGVGALLRFCAKFLPQLRAYPFGVPGVGVAYLDFRDTAAFGMVKIFRLNQFDNDRALFRCLEHILQPGAVFWDVGANVGFVSGYFANRRFQLKSIEAFEPNPRMNAALGKLFADCAKVRVHACGLGDKDDTIQMSVFESDSLVGSMSRALPGAKTIDVRVVRGDSLVNERRAIPPDLIKIDVEGFEPKVFRGLAHTIVEHAPIIVFEHIWLTDEQILALVPADYSLSFLQDNGVIETDIGRRRGGHDAILIPPGKRLPDLRL